MVCKKMTVRMELKHNFTSLGIKREGVITGLATECDLVKHYCSHLSVELSFRLEPFFFDSMLSLLLSFLHLANNDQASLSPNSNKSCLDHRPESDVMTCVRVLDPITIEALDRCLWLFLYTNCTCIATIHA
jgi:hypothetical protein